MNHKLPLKYLPDVKIILAAILFYIAARLGYFLGFQDVTALPSWPPSGIAFALIILLGRASWPGITIGALVSNIMAYWNNQELDQHAIISISCFIAVGQTLEILSGNLLVKKWIRDDYPFRKTKDTFRFLFVTLFMCLVGTIINTFGLYINGVVTPGGVISAAFTGWVANVVGILLFTPLILSLAQKRKIEFPSEQILESFLLVACITSLWLLVKFGYFNSTLIDSLPYLLIPFLLWLAFRFNLLMAVSGVMTTSIISIYFTIQHSGPFIQINPSDSMLLVQIFIAVISISTIVLSSTVAERTQVQLELKSFSGNLEVMVTDRTRELHEEISTRKEAEDKLIVTNTELSKRNTELDNFVYSVSHDLRAPIASVLGLTRLALQDKTQAMKNIYLEKITLSALQQDNFIKEILDQSRNSRLELKKEEILFAPLIEETFNQLSFAWNPGLVVEKSIQVNQTDIFYNDKWRLKVILNNIISNSIRYKNGKDPVIRIQVDVVDHKAYLSIQDNGRGIAEEHLDHVYRMFYRATDEGAGSGLGLYIVKETIDKLRGQVEIQSEIGKGTLVKLEIPELE